jgi:hypothetical protein
LVQTLGDRGLPASMAMMLLSFLVMSVLAARVIPAQRVAG